MKRRLILSPLLLSTQLLAIALTVSPAHAGGVLGATDFDRYDVSGREFSRGLAADRSDDTDAARGGYLAALDEDPLFVEAMVNLARVELEGGDLATARTWVDRALGQSPTYPAASALAGAVSLRAGAIARAVGELRTARALAPGDVGVLTNLGAALIRRRQFAEARTILEQAVRLDPTCAEATFNLGLALDSAGDSGRAAHHYGVFLLLADQSAPSLESVRARLEAVSGAAARATNDQLPPEVSSNTK